MEGNTQSNNKIIKCIIWDLDNTLWNGILLEDKEIKLKEGIVEILEQLDSKGILNSIVSKNDYDKVVKKLEEFNILKFFLYPQIGWNAKSFYVSEIKKKLNISMDNILFIDDDPFEREEVASGCKNVQCMDASNYKEILNLDVIKNMLVTQDSSKRRILYINDIKRTKFEEKFEGSKEEFLKSLKMELHISDATKEQLKRCEELIIRTNQLNSTGITYSEEELNNFMEADNSMVLVGELKDRLGSYGIISLVLIEMDHTMWKIKLLITSCRVISRGIGSILLSFIMNCAKDNNRIVKADFIHTGKNRNMYITYKFSYFKEESIDEKGRIEFVNNLENIPKIPEFIKIKTNIKKVKR